MINLRLLSKEDLPFLLEIRNDYSTRINLENDSVFTLEQCERWFETLNSPWYIITKDEMPVGYIRTDGKEIGCDIHPNHRRNGYAREAYNLILRDMDTASLWVFDDNFAKSLYLELGFNETGEQKIVRGRNYIKMVYVK
jgi:hypothetical protein